MSAEPKMQASSASHSTKVNTNNFRPFAAPSRKAGLQDDQIAVSKHIISLPMSIATKLGDKVSLLWSDTDKAIAIQKASDGDYKLKQIGKNKSSKNVYCKGLIYAEKVKPCRYTTHFDEKTQMLMAAVQVGK